MRTPLFELQDLLNAFGRKKILTREEIRHSVGCSSMTVWRLLRQQGYFTSYNANARYYTIAGIPKFDQHGLWAYRNARFSKWGSLTDTIIGLIQESSAGLDAGELQQLLDVKSVKPMLTQLFQKELLSRETVEGRFVYFPSRKNSQRKQQKQRREIDQKKKEALALLPLENIIALLVEIIRRPKNTPRQWAHRLTQQGIRIATSDIRLVLDHYGIDPKKGLLNF